MAMSPMSAAARGIVGVCRGRMPLRLAGKSLGPLTGMPVLREKADVALSYEVHCLAAWRRESLPFRKAYFACPARQTRLPSVRATRSLPGTAIMPSKTGGVSRLRAASRLPSAAEMATIFAPFRPSNAA